MAERIEDQVRAKAVLSVGRGCFFGALAIWCVMIGLIAEPLQSLKSGAILTMLLACVLLLKAGRVTHLSYKRTEVWLLLDRRIDLPPVVAQQIITRILRDVYLRATLYATIAAIGFWFMALLFWLFGAGNGGFGGNGGAAVPSLAARAVDSLIGWWAGP
ncbi:hypothetical protein [Ferrovibrio sp.]|uniref:hypothetical protein n=1 Tax=Ferrovibrio sp. TaxID=1917215 RepID=UPI003120205E